MASTGVPTVGVDVGGTKLLGVVASADGAVLAEQRRPTPTGPDAGLADIAALVAGLGAEVPGVAAVGLGVAGLISFDGVVHHSPNLPGWDGVAARGRIEAACGLPTALDNDANVAGLAELLHGAAQGYRDVLLATLGTGVGGAVIAGGQVLRGAHGMAAEIGHFQVDAGGPPCACGGIGHWEAIASGRALGRMGRERAAAGEAANVLRRAGGRVELVTGVHVGDSAQAGEPDGLALLCAFARNVAVGLGGLVNILDPELVVIGGGLVELGDLLLDGIRAELGNFVEGPGSRPLPGVVAARLGERAGAIGAAALARRQLAGGPVSPLVGP